MKDLKVIVFVLARGGLTRQCERIRFYCRHGSRAFGIPGTTRACGPRIIQNFKTHLTSLLASLLALALRVARKKRPAGTFPSGWPCTPGYTAGYYDCAMGGVRVARG